MNYASTSRSASVTPSAAALIEGLRDIGYSLETAVADIIDNSITAGASQVLILTETSCEDPYIAILDDGGGMTEQELVAAMRLGSKNPLEFREAPDLGRFGLGMKSASFSQCRRLTVVSRKGGSTATAVWDLDEVSTRNEWAIQLFGETSGIPEIDRLGPVGTLIIWQKLDRLAGGYAENNSKRAEVINRIISETEWHLRLVFHRFIGGGKPLRIALNGRTLRALDPFVQNNLATIADPEERMVVGGGEVIIQSFTVPHHKQISAADWDDIGGPDGYLKTQGFYLYRGKRLILYGTWFGLCRQLELTKLSRVRIDIPNCMDADWKIDVKKSSAQLPPIVRDRLKKVIERIQSGSKRTYVKRGSKLVEKERLPMWVRIQSEGEIRYRPNVDHPAIVDFCNKVPNDLQRSFLNCIALVGASLPIETLYADMAGYAEQVVPDRVDESALTQAVQSIISACFRSGKEVQEILSMMKGVDPFRSAWDDTLRIVESIIKTKDNI